MKTKAHFLFNPMRLFLGNWDKEQGEQLKHRCKYSQAEANGLIGKAHSSLCVMVTKHDYFSHPHFMSTEPSGKTLPNDVGATIQGSTHNMWSDYTTTLLLCLSQHGLFVQPQLKSTLY